MAKKSTPSAAVSSLKETPTAPVATSGALALFKDQNGIDFSKLRATRLNAPRMILPKEMPIGGCFIGQIVKVSMSPATAVKGRVLWMKTQSGEDFLFPIVGAMRQALMQNDLLVTKETGTGDEKQTVVLLDESTKKLAGKWIGVKRLEDGRTQKFASDEEKKAGGKRMYLLDVFLLDGAPAAPAN